MHYAGFWRRFLAAIIDSVISTFALAGIHHLMGIPPTIHFHIYATTGALSAQNAQYIQSITSSPEYTAASILSILFAWLYGALFISSKWQGTPGMKTLRMRVVDYNGHRIGFERASIRYIGFVISCFTLGIGFIIIAFTSHKQAIQDFIARTYVLKDEDSIS